MEKPGNAWFCWRLKPPGKPGLDGRAGRAGSGGIPYPWQPGSPVLGCHRLPGAFQKLLTVSKK